MNIASLLALLTDIFDSTNYKKLYGIVIMETVMHKKTPCLNKELLVPSPGIEPGTQGFSVLCSTN